MYRQIQISQDTKRLTTWVKHQVDLKVGRFVSLDGEQGWWRIMWISAVKLERPPLTQYNVGGIRR